MADGVQNLLNGTRKTSNEEERGKPQTKCYYDLKQIIRLKLVRSAHNRDNCKSKKEAYVQFGLWRGLCSNDMVTREKKVTADN